MTVRESSKPPGIGDPILRKEDHRLLTGQGKFSDDFNLDGQVYAAIVRSPYAHARIRSVNKAPSLGVPGILAVYTGTDTLADGLLPIPHNTAPSSPPDISLINRDGKDHVTTDHHVLPVDKVRFVGEAVAMVVGDTLWAAKAGADALVIIYEELPSVTDTAMAAAIDAPLVHDHLSSNLCIDADVGDKASTDAAFTAADHVVRFETWIRRVTGVPMEPRAAIAIYEPNTDRYTIFAGGGGSVRQKRENAGVLGVDFDKVRIVARDVGGNFGTRNSFYPEFALTAWASRRLRKPVKWTCERTEAFTSDYQGRDLFVKAELALDKEGNFLGLRGTNLSNVGAHTVSFVPLTKGVEIMNGVYRIPACHFRAQAVMSNTPATNPYRSAGRPEVMFVMERLVDLASRQCKFDPVDLRRRNMIRPEEMPYDNKLGMTYDSGAYQQVLDRVIEISDRAGFEARKSKARKRGKYRGFGIAAYMETSTGAPRERTEITVRPDGQVDVVIGTLSSGQGHETSFAQLISEWLGVPIEGVNLLTGDTDVVKYGGGSHSGRSMRLAGIIMGTATDEIILKGTGIAAHILEAAKSDIVFKDARFTVAGTDRSVGIFEAAQIAEKEPGLPKELQGALCAISDQVIKVPAFPFGAHTCEVEVDVETGQVDLVTYTGIDDVGRAVNPLILHGQAHGAIVQGLGEAMMELCNYDAKSGQMLTASFMDYAMPRADDMPSLATEISEIPSPTNPLGIRAGGEGGTTPALAVLVNAVVDALSQFGIEHIEMPLTPEAVWRVLRNSHGLNS